MADIRLRLALLTGLAMASPGLGLAQEAPAPRLGATARPNAGPVGPGMGPLQSEPGDIWAEVRGWTQERPKPPVPAPPAKPAKAKAKPAPG